MKIDRTEIRAGPIGICQDSGKIWGCPRSPAPTITRAAFWRMNDTPTAVISGASRELCRNGR